MASQPVYQFYSELKDCTPRVWRRFQVAGNATVARLGYIMMTLYEMRARHQFCIDYSEADICPVTRDQKVRYEVSAGELFPEPMDEREKDATQVTLRQLTVQPGTVLHMEYDFGDGWEIELRLEDILQDEAIPGKLLPRVLEGEGYGIIEDCGGPDSLKLLLRENPDLSVLNLDDMNFRLKKIPRIFRDLYEYNYAPTKYSVGLLERKYLEKKADRADEKLTSKT